MKKNRNSNRIILITAALAVFGFGLAFVFNFYEVYVYWRDGRASQELSETIREVFSDATPYNLQARFAAITNTENTESSNFIAYLSVPNTNIGHIVMQSADNDFYLHHDIFGNSNVNGSLFMDYRNTANFGDPNTIIYGHNMRNGTMFHNLRYFMDYDFFHAHPHIRVITKTQTLTYEIFAAFSAATDFDYIQVFFDPPEELQGLINELTARRNFDTKITPSIYDRILILSTCTNIQEDTRFVVAARLMNDAN